MMQDADQAYKNGEQMIAFARTQASSSSGASRGENDPAVAKALMYGLLILAKLDLASVKNNAMLSHTRKGTAIARLEECLAKASRVRSREALICAQEADELLSKLKQSQKINPQRSISLSTGH